MSTEQNNPCESEAVLLRLVRCMTESDREEIIRLALGMLGKRCSFDPRYTRSSAEDLRLELENSKLDERMMAACPGDWPGRQVVDLDNVGDTGAWLSEKLEGAPLAQTLFGWNWGDEANAAMLAEEYLRAVIEAGHFPPSYYGDEAGDGEDGWPRKTRNWCKRNSSRSSGIGASGLWRRWKSKIRGRGQVSEMSVENCGRQADRLEV